MTDAGLRTARFVSDALPDDTFDLLDLRGLEELNRLFAFHLRLAVREPARVRGQTQALLEAPAHLVFFDDGREVRRVHGVLSELSLDLDVGLEQAELAVTLVPRVWALTQRQATELALDRSVPQLLLERLTRLGLKEGDDVQLRLLGRHETREMVVQHQESDWAFLCRLCEQVGIFFAFAHASGRDVLVFGDQPDELWGSQPVEVPYRRRGDTRGAFTVREEVRRGPSAVQLSDYNYRLPGVSLRGQHEVQGPGGWGVQRLWGEHVKTPEEAEARAEVRAQQSAQERVRVSGQTTELALTAGSVLVLSEPLGTERRVLVTRLGTHVSVTLGPDGALQATSETSFEGLPEGVAFRPERRTPWPRVPGLVHAVVDGAADGTYAELDEQGRYQVVFGHDATTQGAMRRSRPVRMLQPHGGGDYGMHFPLRPGTEVLVGHVEGDPDRPVIVGVAPNPATSSPVGAGNATENVLRSGSRNELVMEDALGAERVRLHSPYENTTLQLGSMQEPEQGALLSTLANLTLLAGATRQELSQRHATFADLTTTLTGGNRVDLAGVTGLDEDTREPGAREMIFLSSFDRVMSGLEGVTGEEERAPSGPPRGQVSSLGGPWSQRLDGTATDAQSRAQGHVQRLAQQSDEGSRMAAPRAWAGPLEPMREPSWVSGSSGSATLFARGKALVHGHTMASLVSDEVTRVVSSERVEVHAGTDVEIAGRRAVRVTTRGLLDVRAGQVAFVVARDPEATTPPPLPPSVAFGLSTDQGLHLQSLASTATLTAEKDVLVHSHAASVRVTAPGAIVASGGAVEVYSGSKMTLAAKGNLSVSSDGDVEIKAAGSLSIKAASISIESDGTLTLKGATVQISGPTTADSDLTVAGSLSAG